MNEETEYSLYVKLMKKHKNDIINILQRNGMAVNGLMAGFDEDYIYININEIPIDEGYEDIEELMDYLYKLETLDEVIIITISEYDSYAAKSYLLELVEQESFNKIDFKYEINKIIKI